MNLQAKLLDPHQIVLFYGTTPPRLGTSNEAIRSTAEKLVARIGNLPVDGIVVYDIQDEAGRTGLPRPFTFTHTVEPREYARLLSGLSGKPSLIYKCVGDFDADAFQEWLTESARDYGVKFLSIVGRPSSRSPQQLPLQRALRLAAEHPAGFAVGGVVIAERHTPSRSEASRLIAKSNEGARYFVSQTVYHAQKTIALLKDYLRECRDAQVQPKRIVLTFAPCGREKTMSFIKWLGVDVQPELERAIFSASDPLTKSIEICADNLRQILQEDYVGQIPLGLNVESVSINRDELDATVTLFETLAKVFRSAAHASSSNC